MKYTLKAECPKDIFLTYTKHSVECKFKDNHTYGFYDNVLGLVNDEISLTNVNIPFILREGLGY